MDFQMDTPSVKHFNLKDILSKLDRKIEQHHMTQKHIDMHKGRKCEYKKDDKLKKE